MAVVNPKNYKNYVQYMTATLRIKSRGAIYYPVVRTFIIDTRKRTSY